MSITTIRFDEGLKWRLLLGLSLGITLGVNLFLPDFLTDLLLQSDDVGFLHVHFTILFILRPPLGHPFFRTSHLVFYQEWDVLL